VKLHYIYKITNTVNGKVYIGKSVDPKARWSKHISNAKRKPKDQFFYLQASINKYGEDSFSLDIIDECESAEVAYSREIYWIDYYKSKDPKIGMNLTIGGDGSRGHTLSAEARKRISEANIGRAMSEGHRQKIIAVNTGKIRSEETRKKMSIHQIGPGNHQYGKHHSSEHSRKVSEKLSGRVVSEDTKNKMREAWKNRNGATKLTKEDVISMRLLISQGVSELDLLNKFGISKDYVHKISMYKAWKHLPLYTNNSE